jgi:hypothetical protein
MQRLETTLRALRHFARGDVVCELPSTIARWADVSVDSISRGIADAIDDGLLERTPMRNGKATAYLLLGSASTSSDAVVAAAEESSLRDSSAAQVNGRSSVDGIIERGESESTRKRWNQSPMNEADREWMLAPADPERFDWPEYIAARQELERLCYGVRSLDDKLIARTAPGECADCARIGGRLRFGAFALCRRCVVRRVAVQVKASAEIACVRVPFLAPPTKQAA